MTRNNAPKTFNLILCSAVLFCVDSIACQNIVGHTAAQFTANPVRLTDTDVSEFLLRAGNPHASQDSPDAKRTADKLDADSAGFLDGRPRMPFQFTLNERSPAGQFLISADRPRCKAAVSSIQKCGPLQQDPEGQTSISL